MKKYSLLLLVFLMTAITGSAQNRRLVLIEEFTNTGCGPCASWSPLLDSCINYRLGDVIAIKYHSVYPENTDPFYLENKEAQQAKVDYYNVTGVPTTFVNGIELTNRSYAALSSAITYCLTDQPTSFNLTIEKSLVGQQLTAKATLTTEITDFGTRDLRLHVVAIEEHLERVCSNGETELNYTMRSMLTSPEGEKVVEQLSPQQPFVFSGECNISHFYSENQLGVVAFLQDHKTHEVLATAYIGPNAEGENRLALMDLIDTPDLICTPNYYGNVIFRNDGANTLTSATLNVKVNGIVKQYPWTGSLDYLDHDTLAFDQFTAFDLVDSGRNAVEVWFSDINGSDALSNTRTSAFSNSVQATYDVQLKIYTDKKPEEISWKLYDSAGDVVRQGGPYDGQVRKFITENLALTRNDCYLLEFLDAGGNGIKGANGNGYYQLLQLDEAGKTKRIAQGDYDGAVYDVFFNLTNAPQPESRLVLFEEFTNTSCDPCAEFSPALDQTISDRMGDMVAITYHYNFPSPQDPFYLASSTDVMARAGYYDVSGVPALRVNGERVGSWGYEQYLDGYVTGASEIPAKVNIDAEAKLDNGLLTVSVSLLPKGLTDGSSLRLHVAAVEERVEWSQPAENGERSWNYVLRKLLTGPNGQPLETELTQVTPYHYEYSWQVQNYYDENELGIVAFVQDNNTKEVIGAVYTPRPTGSQRALKILQVLNTPNRICAPMFSSDLKVRNTGRETLNSANINVSINGQVQTTPWTGRLDYLDIATLHTPLFNSFTLNDNGANQVEIWLSDLNGQTEESVHKSFTIVNAHKAQNAVRLTLMTDQMPQEITWKVYNSAGDVVCEGGPYTEARKKQVVDLPLSIDDCYTLAFEDAGGDGITGDNGRGYYMLHEVSAEGKTRLLVQADYTTAHHEVYFSLENASDASVHSVATPSQPDAPAYDLQGRPATERTQVVVREGKMTVNK